MRFVFWLMLLLSMPVSATTHYLYNYSTADIVSSKNSDAVVPIASVTKLFTAAVVLEQGLDLNEKVIIKGKTKGRFPLGTHVTRLELLKAMLIASDNLAADSLANSFPGGYPQFLEEANLLAGRMGFKNTKIEDASGIGSGNVSTAEELSNFVWYLRRHQLIIEISSSIKDEVEVELKKKIAILPIRNTNPDISKYNKILISKTGFTSKAGRCLVLLLDYNNEFYSLVVLGEKNPVTRSKTVNNLINKI